MGNSIAFGPDGIDQTRMHVQNRGALQSQVPPDSFLSCNPVTLFARAAICLLG